MSILMSMLIITPIPMNTVMPSPASRADRALYTNNNIHSSYFLLIICRIHFIIALLLLLLITAAPSTAFRADRDLCLELSLSALGARFQNGILLGGSDGGCEGRYKHASPPAKQRLMAPDALFSAPLREYSSPPETPAGYAEQVAAGSDGGRGGWAGGAAAGGSGWAGSGSGVGSGADLPPPTHGVRITGSGWRLLSGSIVEDGAADGAGGGLGGGSGFAPSILGGFASKDAKGGQWAAPVSCRGSGGQPFEGGGGGGLSGGGGGFDSVGRSFGACGGGGCGFGTRDGGGWIGAHVASGAGGRRGSFSPMTSSHEQQHTGQGGRGGAAFAAGLAIGALPGDGSRWPPAGGAAHPDAHQMRVAVGTAGRRPSNALSGSSSGSRRSSLATNPARSHRDSAASRDTMAAQELVSAGVGRLQVPPAASTNSGGLLPAGFSFSQQEALVCEGASPGLPPLAPGLVSQSGRGSRPSAVWLPPGQHGS
ncbi:hypothetical protein T492DRAFT_837740 [Pavlovales sp. CCMP2436]|nr:hypothetical protein T492DRAFT_837740 [Pavlovales sp. CCMP2436]